MKTRTEYLGQLDRLAEHLSRLGEAVVSDINATGRALTQDDEGAGQGVIESHSSTLRLKRSVEDECLTLMLLQNPMASDMRFVTAAFRAVSDLSRIDETAFEIAELNQELRDEKIMPKIEQFGELSARAADMVNTAMDAFIEVDADAAETVFAKDDHVDDLYNQVRTHVVEVLRSDNNEAAVLAAPEVLMMAKYYERMGDHAQRIADWAIFRATGKYRGRGIGGSE